MIPDLVTNLSVLGVLLFIVIFISPIGFDVSGKYPFTLYDEIKWFILEKRNKLLKR